MIWAYDLGVLFESIIWVYDLGVPFGRMNWHDLWG